MKSHLPLTLLFALLLPWLACCSNPAADPLPVSSLKQLVQERVEQWVDARMDSEVWTTFKQGENVWSVVQSTTALSNWIQDNIGDPSGVPVLWDFSSFVEEIRNSSIYSRGPPSEEVFVGLLIDALKAYKFEE